MTTHGKETATSGPAPAAVDSNGIAVSVCICSYRRPHLAETIRSVLGQRGLNDRNVEIIIADDDPDRSAREIVAALAAGTAMPVRYVPSGARNVAAARNACLDAARGTWIAFIDDDEIAAPDWLASLLAAQRAYLADVVKGAVHAVYPVGTPDWIRAANPFARDYGPTGETPEMLATGNVLFRRSLVERYAIRFDPGYGRTGGEDTDFFRKVRQTGARIVASREAIVDEIVPIERVSLTYLAGRARRMGQVEARKSRLGSSETPLARSIAIAALYVLVLWPYKLLRPLGARIAYKTFAKFWYSFGILEGAVLSRSDEMS